MYAFNLVPPVFKVEQLYPATAVEEFRQKVLTGDVQLINVDADKLAQSRFDGALVLADGEVLFRVNDFVVHSSNGRSFVTSDGGVVGGNFSSVTVSDMFQPVRGEAIR